MSTDANILKALCSRLDGISTISPQPVIIHPLRRVRSPSGVPFLQAQILLNETATRAVSDQNGQHRGIFQVTVMYPGVLDEGMVPVLEMADAVRLWFAKGTVMDEEGTRVRIIQKPWTAAPYPDGGRTRAPVSIPYVCNVN